MFRFILSLSLVLSLPALPSFAADEPEASAPDAESPLVETRTATELPDRRKIPTSREVGIRPEESDHHIAARLTRIAESQDVFRGIKVEVREGIVALSGKAEDASIAKSFSALSERTEGVIGVIDRIEIEDAKKSGLQVAQSEAKTLFQKIFRSVPYLLSAFGVLVITIAIGLLLLRFWRRILLRRMADRPMFAGMLARLLTAPVYLIGLYLILRVAGMGTLATTVLSGTGLIGIIFGLAGKDILGDYLAGFMLSLRNPFKVGDTIMIGDLGGTIYAVNSRTTMVLDWNGVLNQVPNSTVLASIIQNRNAHSVNQIILPLHLEPDSDLGDFRAAFADAVEKNASALAEDPKSQAFVNSLESGAIRIECYIWFDTLAHSLGKVRSNFLEALLLGLEERGVRLARPNSFYPARPPRITPEARVERQDSKRRALEATVREESAVPSEGKVVESRAKDVVDPEAPGLRTTSAASAERSREAPTRSPTTSS